MSDMAIHRGAANPPPLPATETAISPMQIVGVLRRSWLLLAICGVLFAGAAYLFTALALPKRYTTSGMVSVETRSFAIPALQGALSGEVMPDPMPLVRSEVQVLESRALIGQVVEDLHLRDNPDFNTSLRPPGFVQTIKQDLAATLPSFLGTPLVNAGVLPDPATLSKPPSPLAVQDGVTNAIMHDLSIINDNRSMIIVVQFTALDPQIAAQVVNSLITHYMEGRAKTRDVANGQASTLLTARVAQVRDEIDGLERKIAATREKYNLVQTRAGSVGQQQLEDLSAALTRASADRAQAEANLQRATALARSGGVATDNGEIVGSATLSTLRDREAAAERHVAQLSATLGPGHPQLRAAQAELASARAAVAGEAQRVASSLAAQAGAARSREADLRQQLAAAQGSATNLSAVQSELQQLEKDADARRSVYQTLLQGAAQAASSKDAPEQTGVHVVSTAVPPAFPSSPRPKLAGAFGLLSGLAFGGLISLARGRRDKGFEEPEEVASDLGLATLPLTVPRGHADWMAARVVADPSGVEADALRALRMRLRFSGRSAVPRSVLFASSVAGEGASSVAAAFARVAALDGLRVLLVEGNLHSPSLARLLDVSPSNGMVEILQGQEHWREQVTRDSRTSLDLLLVEERQPRAGQMLEAMQLPNLMAEAREEYNLVVVSSQPVVTATHALVLANMVDAVILVVAPGIAKRETVREAVAALSKSARRQPVVAVSKAA